MSGFPAHANYIGLNAPLGEEYDIEGLEVEGALPSEVEGSFFRAVPNPAYPPFLEDSAAFLSGDGMISAIRFAGGKASIHHRWVQTAPPGRGRRRAAAGLGAAAGIVL